MPPSKEVGKREFIQHTSRYLQWVENENQSLIITHHNEPDLLLTKIHSKKLSDLKGRVEIKIIGDINDQVLPGYDLW